jgi:hypothetical protein
VALYFASMAAGAKLYSAFRPQNRSLVAAPFLVPLTLIVLRFVATQDLRFNSHEYMRFQAYYAAANVGFFAFPILINSGKYIGGDKVVSRSIQ